ncbi:hypothetical protein ZOSMA_791G00010 [Zostera marina]|uniref:Peptidase M10 metallopeptidase domain-containing protein n=1 Tax=Zostera marina TaxID=29655 RepID=A0A0K9NN88_ZOSMR|nr:hypothetical protein ZOSMA_791G00010 [Zostera marina]
MGSSDTSVKSQANIVLQFLPIPGPHVASATAPPSPQVELTFDSGEIWAKGDTPPRPQNSLDLHSVALHLIGHAIGLRHRGNVPANLGTVMNKRLVDRNGNPVVEGITKTSLQTPDIILAETKYRPCNN